MDKCHYHGPYTLDDCTPDDPCAVCERDNLKAQLAEAKRHSMFVEEHNQFLIERLNETEDKLAEKDIQTLKAAGELEEEIKNA